MWVFILLKSKVIFIEYASEMKLWQLGLGFHEDIEMWNRILKGKIQM